MHRVVKLKFVWRHHPVHARGLTYFQLSALVWGVMTMICETLCSDPVAPHVLTSTCDVDHRVVALLWAFKHAHSLVLVFLN